MQNETRSNQFVELKSNINGIDAIFVNSVRTFNDRIAHIESEFKNAGVDFSFVFKFDIPEITEDVLNKYFDKNSDVTLGAKSLLLKNILIWNICVQYSLKRVLVLEDDAVLHKNFRAKIEEIVTESEKIESGYYIFLGGAQSKIPTSFHIGNSKLVKLKGDTAEGYIIDFLACSKFLSWFDLNKSNLPVDALVNTLSSKIGVTQYWSKTFLVEQGSMWGLFESSLDGKRKKRTKLENYLRYKLVVFKRRTFYKWLYRSRYRLLGF